jgi:hypothetical protein|tara:strand:+ start:538 stop:930 length:393 start_codon:yes stop_codon:yes gene_type:complete
MTDWVSLFSNLGIPLALLILVVWKGFPYLDRKNEKHNEAIRLLIEAHESKMEKKDVKIEKLVADTLENHKSFMRIIEANTVVIERVSVDFVSIKENGQHLSLEIEKSIALQNKSAELQRTLIGLFRKDAS